MKFKGLFSILGPTCLPRNENARYSACDLERKAQCINITDQCNNVWPAVYGTNPSPLRVLKHPRHQRSWYQNQEKQLHARMVHLTAKAQSCCRFSSQYVIFQISLDFHHARIFTRISQARLLSAKIGTSGPHLLTSLAS